MTESSFLGLLARRPAWVLVAVVALLLAGFAGLGWRFAEQGLRISVQDSTEASNRTLTRVFVNQNWDAVKPLLPPPGSGVEAAKSNPHIPAIDQIVRRFSLYTDVLKVKIYDRGGVTVYSSDPKQIGEDKARNLGFQAAARGQSASELTYRGKFGAFDGELFDRNLVSTYVPVRVGEEIEAVLEIYADRTQSIEFINRALRQLALETVPWVLLGLVLVAAFGWWLQRILRDPVAGIGVPGAAEVPAGAGDDAVQGEPSRASAGPERLPAAFDDLGALWRQVATARLQPAATGKELAGVEPDAPVRNGELDELLARVASIQCWARVRRDLDRLLEPPGEPVREVFDLDALVSEVLEQVTPLAGFRGWRLSSYRHPATLGMAQGDRARLATVLMHLLGASTDASLTAGLLGQVQFKMVREGRRLRIDVVDDSSGLVQQRLDQWFKDWDLRRTLPETDGQGITGRRLLLVRALVREVGGEFDARGTPGHGNRWSVEMPLELAQASAGDQQPV